MSQLFGNPHSAAELNRLLRHTISEAAPDKIKVITDSNVAPLSSDLLPDADRIIIPAGEAHKNLDSAVYIWQRLSSEGATRNSLLVNIGGGMISDLGGFAAATFKRGIRYINVATTILSAVDAAIGGKTGIDFLGLKNEIGAFSLPVQSFTAFHLLSHLPHHEWLSGYGEILKTSLLIDYPTFAKATDTDTLFSDPAALYSLIAACADLKKDVVRKDPNEKGLRRILNLGHTAGHAFETLALEKGKPIPHGIAVAHGLLIALLLSPPSSLNTSDEAAPTPYFSTSPHFYTLLDVVRREFPRLPITCSDHSRLLSLMTHDKKNRAGEDPSFVLLSAPGNPIEKAPVSPLRIRAALEVYCDLLS